MSEEKVVQGGPKDPEEVIEVECECGEKIQGPRKKLYYLYKMHQTDHPELTAAQWTESARRIERARDAAKARAGQ